MRKRAEDDAKVKKQQRQHQGASMSNKRLSDNDKVKEEQIKRSRLCRNKKKLDDPERAKAEQNEQQQRHRKVNNRSDRLKEFREATKYAAIFICTCCQQRMFHSNVQLYTQALKDKINALKSGHTDACVQREIEIRIEEDNKTYICKTCVGHMRKKKLPPMSAMNGLQLDETDEMIKK